MTHNGPDSMSRAMRGINAVMEGEGVDSQRGLPKGLEGIQCVVRRCR
jgi:hypothetical protein